MKVNNKMENFCDFSFKILSEVEIMVKELCQNMIKPSESVFKIIIQTIQGLSIKLSCQKFLITEEITDLANYGNPFKRMDFQFSSESGKVALNELKKYQLLNAIASHYVIKSVLPETSEHNKETMKINHWKKDDFHLNQTACLCIRQLEVCCALLIDILLIEQENDAILIDSRKYILTRMQWCFSELKTANETQAETLNAGSFLKLMNKVLDEIVSIDLNSPLTERLSDYKMMKDCIDELLCHAMTVGQVALETDQKAIKAGCQNILLHCDAFCKEFQKGDANLFLCKFNLEVLTNSLYSVEKRVNNAVLRLLLEVFKSKNSAVQKFRELFKSNKDRTARNSSDLDDAIVDFDLYTDRIMQIGLFAVSCSTDKQKIFAIRNGIACLESLETELVPAMTARYMCSKSNWLETDLHADFLIDHWCSTIDVLEDQIHRIVDPYAFSKVVLDYCTNLVEKIRHKLKKKQLNQIKMGSQKVCNCAAMYRRHLKIYQDDLKDNNEIVPEDFQQLDSSYSKILKECLTFVGLCDKDENINNIQFYERLLKRFLILITMMKRLRKHFESDGETSKTDNQVLEEYSGKESSDDDTNSFNLELNSENIPENKPLALIMLRSEVLRKERSVLYQSPKKLPKVFVQSNIENKENLTVNKTVLNKNRAKSFVEREDKTNDSLDLNITAILEELTATCALTEPSPEDREIFV